MKSRWVGFTAGFLVVYVAAYVLNIKAVPPLVTSSYATFKDTGGPRLADYRLGGEISQFVFLPILAVDRWLRPEYWHTNVDPWNARGEMGKN